MRMPEPAQQAEIVGSDPEFEPIDWQFAEFVQRLDPGSAPAVGLAARVLSRATRAGHVFLALEDLANWAHETGAEPVQPEAWRGALRGSAVVGSPGEFAPLILDEQGRLYLQRYWQYEADVSSALRGRAALREPFDAERLCAVLDPLFPAAGDGVDWQRVAAAVALTHRLTIISGGPGSGKTTTVLRILVALLQYSGRPLRIALAAPTGLAAARLEQALMRGKAALTRSAEQAALVPERAMTLHRLLGARRHSVYFQHDRARPLPLDVLVVDEASMIDLALMAKTLWALPPQARLLLLGDKDQLASVEAGAVLGDLCEAGAAFSPDFAAAMTRVCPGLVAQGEPGVLVDNVVFLRHSYRFQSASGIGRLGRAVIAGDAESAWQVLTAPGATDVRFTAPLAPRADVDAFRDRILAGYGGYLERLAAGADAAEIAAAFNTFRVLCAHRTGGVGAVGINDRIESVLATECLIDPRTPWYAGRPVVIQENDYELGVFNGDIGIVLPADDDRRGAWVYFLNADGRLRRYAPSRLPRHELGYALTVHKAQGSEFDRVLLLLPDRPSPVVTRELLYTAVTRARTHVDIWGTEAVLRDGIRRRVVRSSALAARLRE
jgi:exodeoxyribonuclease V alpha subunit